MRCSSLAILLAASVAWSADPPKFSTPEADFPSDDLRGPGPDDKTYPLAQDAAKSKDLRAKRLAWYREQIVAPFDAGEGAKGKGAAEGKKALEATAEYFAASRGSPWSSTFGDARDALSDLMGTRFGRPEMPSMATPPSPTMKCSVKVSPAITGRILPRTTSASRSISKGVAYSSDQVSRVIGAR